MSEIIGASVAIEVPGEAPDDTLIAVIQRDDDPTIPYPGFWELPGGTLDTDDESPEAGALREVFEEIGVRLSEDQIVWRALYQSVRFPGVYNAFFVVTLSTAPGLILGSEGRSCKFMPVREFESDKEVILDHRDRYNDYRLGVNGLRVTIPKRLSLDVVA